MSHKTDATLRPFLFAFSHCAPFLHASTKVSCVGLDCYAVIFWLRQSYISAFSRSDILAIAKAKVFIHNLSEGQISRRRHITAKAISRRRHITAVRLIAPKVHRFSRRQKHRIIAYYFVFIVYYNFYYYIKQKNFWKCLFFALQNLFYMVLSIHNTLLR